MNTILNSIANVLHVLGNCMESLRLLDYVSAFSKCSDDSTYDLVLCVCVFFPATSSDSLGRITTFFD